MLPTEHYIKQERRAAIIRAALTFLIAAVLGATSLLLHPYAAIALFVAGALAAFYVYHFSTATSRRRKKIVAREFPPHWREILLQRVDYYRELSQADKVRFEQNVQIFLDEKTIEGAGVESDDTLRILVAAAAIIPVFGFPGWEYGMLELVVVRPVPFEAHFKPDVDDPLYACGMVGDGGIFGGTLILSAPDLLHDFQLAHDKHNVGIHEFAHLIDKAGGHIDGVPVSLPYKSLKVWVSMVHAILSQGRKGQNKDIPAYGFTNESEFFAVVSEYFFEKPAELAKHHPQLYDMLETIFRQYPLKTADLSPRNNGTP